MSDQSKEVVCAVVGHKFETVVSSLVPALPGAFIEVRGRHAQNQTGDAAARKAYTWIACVRCGKRPDNVAEIEIALER